MYNYLLCLFMFLFGFAGMYSIMNKKYKDLALEDSDADIIPPFIYLWSLFAIGYIGGYFLTNGDDFIINPSFWRIIIPLCGAFLIYYSCLLFSPLISSLIIITCVTADVYMQPFETIEQFLTWPIWSVQIILIILGSCFCIFYQILNISAKIFALTSIIPLAGVAILSFVNAAPMYSAISAILLLSLLLAYMQYNSNEDKVIFDNASCCAIAFLIAQILFLQLSEYSFTSCAIFTSLFWAELLSALWNKYVLFRSGSLYENTNYYQMTQKYSIHFISMSIAKTGFFIIFIGWLQLFSIVSYVLIPITSCIILWMNHNIAYPTERKTFSQLNKELMENIKQNIQETKDVLQNKKDKED